MFSLAGLVMLNFFGVLYLNYKINQPATAASLQINKVVSEANPLTGSIFTYRLQYRCASLTDNCTGVMITDPLPAAVEFVSMTGSSHTVNEVYDAGTRTCTFTFQDPLISGTTGQVLVRVRFPNGTTPNGTIASNTATISGTNAPSVTATVAATAVASDKVEVDKEFLSGGSAGGTATYHLGICNNGGVTNQNGTLRAENIIIRDTLPPGSVYVSSNVGGGTTVNYNASDHVVTLTRPSLDPGQCIFPKITISYPDPPFNLGSTVTNTAYFSYTPIGASPVTTSDTETITIISPTPYAVTVKSSSHASLRPGNRGTYEIDADIAGTEDLNDFCITDTIPAGIWIRRFSMGGWYFGGATGPAPNIINVTYTTNLNGPTLVSGSPFSMWNHTFYIDTENDLGLLPGGGEYITSITYCFGDVPAGLATYEPIRLEHRIMNGTPAGTITNCAELTTSSAGIVLDEGCVDLNIVLPLAGSVPDPWKSFRLNAVDYFHDVGDTTTVFLRTRNGTSAGMDLTEPTMYELLPAELTYISGSQRIPGNGTWNNMMGAPTPIFTETPNYNGSGRTLLTWSWTGAASFDFAPGDELRVYIDVIVNENAAGGMNSFYNEVFIEGGNAIDCWGYDSPDIYDLNGNGNLTELICTDSTRFNVTPVVSLESEKLVKGQLDTDWTKYPETGYTVPGGLADYQLIVRNQGNIELDSIIVIDILPFVGDEGVIDLNTRNSRWRPNLVGAVSAPPGVTVYYSTEGNPCRSAEQVVASGPAGCTTANWTTTPPTDITTVQSLKFDFGAIILSPRDSLVLEWPMRAPVDALTTIGAQPDSTAWSSFGYIGQRVDNGDFLLPTEPIKVGISMSNSVPAVIGDYVWVDQNQNGRQNGTEPGYDGMRVELFKDNGDGISDPTIDTFINFTATANGGYYLFPYLPAGDYFLLYYKPAPYGITTPNVGGNDAVDSDAQLMNYNGFVVGVTPVTNLSGTEYDLDWDFGIYPNDLGAIGNYVWADINNDGIQNEATSFGVNGVVVNLYQNSNPSTIYAIATTADDVNGNPGYYLFDGLTPGDYFVEFVLPSGSTFTNQGATGTSDVGDSDVNITNGRTEVFSVVANVYDDSWDAGLILSGVEVCTNGIDDDFDGEIDEDCDEICTNGIDDDGDGLIDCYDGDCNCFAACGDTDGDGIGDNCDLDDDNDGIPDLVESRCDENIVALCTWDHNGSPYTIANIWNPAIIAAAANEVVGTGLTVTEASTTLEIAGINQASLGGAITDQDYLEYSFTTAAGIDALYVLDFFYTKNDFAPANNYGYFISIAYSNDGFASSSFLLNEYEVSTFVNGTQQNIRVAADNKFAFLSANTSYTFRIYFYGKSTPGIARFDDFALESGQCQWSLDTDNDGILNYLDLDSDNDGIFDAHEAGHGETVGADGRIVGADTGSGTNGLFDVLETAADNDILNYSIADSENSADGIYDPYELDSDGDLCYDTKEESVSDNDNDGIAGTGTPTVDGGGLVDGHTYTAPPNNFWQNASLSNCLSITGIVFEDINYGGGDGRNYATADASAQASGWNANDIAVENASVELYNSSGDFLATTQTDVLGQYSFLDLPVGTYSVRVVNQSVASNRASNSTGERITPVQTFRRNSTVEIVNEVGGAAPNLIDNGANSANLNLSVLTTSTEVAQSVTSITLSNADLGNINFGYNFDVVVNRNDEGQGSLRQFILNSNELTNTNLDQEDNPTNGVNFPKALAWETSIFMIPGAGNHTIQPLSVLPTILDDQTHLTAYTQNGALQGPISSRTLRVELYGDGVTFDGITIRANDVQVSGFSINSFRKGIYSNQNTATNTFVWGNYVGTKLDGITSATNTGEGIQFYNINNSYVGTNADNVNDANEGNIVSNSYNGIELRGTSDVLVAGNYVGIDKNGTADLGNRYIGVHIRDAAGVNHIGFNDALVNNNADQLRNVLSGNGTDGVRITNGDNQVIAGNYIGTDVTGTVRISNTGYGVQLLGNVSNLLVGTNSNGDDDVLERNIISGNGSGLRFLSSGSGANNRIAGNFVGTDVTGNTALGNLTSGIDLNGSFTNTIIGTNGDNVNDLIERNIISGNIDDGIRMSSTNGHTIAGNYIGVGADGISNVGNQKRGILLALTASNNTIGFDPSMANTNELVVGNQIKNNNDAGIGHAGTGTQNRISRNQLANNAGIGIDLGYDSVTANDDGDGDTGANTLLNFPVLESVIEVGGNLVITGFAPSGAAIEFFRADAGPNPNPLPGGFTTSFGEGAVYLFTATEGSGDDTDGTVGSYVDDGTGATSTKTQNRFAFTVDTTGFNLSNGLNITATATDINENTSEFSGWLDFRFTEVCDNGLDDDGDGLTDCDDDDCEVLASPFTLLTCDNSNGGGRGIFFLPDANTTVSNGSSSRIVSYHESLSDAQNRVNILPNSFISYNNTLYARVENSLTGCYATSILTLSVGSICAEDCADGIDNDGDGLIDCQDCDECATFAGCGDNDGDGIGDLCDLDDDNDGIPDLIECPGFTYGAELVINGDFEDAYANWTSNFNRGRNNNGPTRDGCPTQGWVAISPCASYNGICDSYYNYYGGTPDGSVVISDAYGTGANVISTTNCNISVDQCIAGPLPDHTTTGTGLSLYVDPSNIAGRAYWQQLVTVEAGKNYEFSAWIMVIEEDPNLQFRINGSNLTAGFNLDRLTGGTDGPDAWQQFFAYWYSAGTSGDVLIELVNLTAGCGGNDIRVDDVSLREIITDCDCDGDGVDNSLDLDSDNDGILDVVEAGHGAIDANNDGIIDAAALNSGDNGLYNLLETTAESGIINYTVADSETTPDGIFDICELDADGDGCFDAEEEAIADPDGDGRAGTGTPLVNPANGLINTITYVDPPNNNWQNPLVGPCLPESCDDGIDNDADGLTDCDDPDCITSPAINISSTTACINETITVSSTNLGGGATYTWDFGVDAIPATATGIGPHNVAYTSCGTKNIQLTAFRNTCTIVVDSSINVVDNIDPVWVNNPQDLIMECLPSANYSDSISIWLNNYGNGAATDNCNSVRIINDYSGLTTDCGSTESTVVTFTALDSCGNSATAMANIQILDRLAPEIASIPNITVDCDVVPMPPSPIIVDSCDVNPSLVFQEVIIQHPNDTWKASSDCSILYEISSGFYDDKSTASTADDEVTFTITVIGQNVSAGWNATVNGTPIGGEYYKSYQVGPLTSSGTIISFTITDSNDVSCAVTVIKDTADF